VKTTISLIPLVAGFVVDVYTYTSMDSICDRRVCVRWKFVYGSGFRQCHGGQSTAGKPDVVADFWFVCFGVVCGRRKSSASYHWGRMYTKKPFSETWLRKVMRRCVS